MSVESTPLLLIPSAGYPRFKSAPVSCDSGLCLLPLRLSSFLHSASFLILLTIFEGIGEFFQDSVHDAAYHLNQHLKDTKTESLCTVGSSL